MTIRRVQADPADGRGAAVLEVAGDLDVGTAALLESEVLLAVSRSTPHVDIDLSSVTFIDSYGLRALVGAHRAAGAAGATFAIVNPSAVAHRVLVLTGLDQLFVATADDEVEGGESRRG